MLTEKLRQQQANWEEATGYRQVEVEAGAPHTHDCICMHMFIVRAGLWQARMEMATPEASGKLCSEPEA